MCQECQKNVINAKCGKKAISAKSEFKVELERDRDAAEFPTTCVTSRFSNPETSVVPAFCEFLLFFLGSYFSSM